MPPEGFAAIPANQSSAYRVRTIEDQSLGGQNEQTTTHEFTLLGPEFPQESDPAVVIADAMTFPDGSVHTLHYRGLLFKSEEWNETERFRPKAQGIAMIFAPDAGLNRNRPRGGLKVGSSVSLGATGGAINGGEIFGVLGTLFGGPVGTATFLGAGALGGAVLGGFAALVPSSIGGGIALQGKLRKTMRVGKPMIRRFIITRPSIASAQNQKFAINQQASQV